MFPLVEYETNKYIHNSYHNKKYQDNFNLYKFLELIKNSEFKELREYNQVSNFFQPSIAIIAKEILDDLLENGFKRQPRLKIFLKDLEIILDLYEHTLKGFDLENIKLFYKSARNNIISNNANLELAKADMANLIQKYEAVEKNIIIFIIQEMAKLVSNNYSFILFDFHYKDDQSSSLNNITEIKIKEYFTLLLIILMNKNITKEEIVSLFTKLCSYGCDYRFLTKKDKRFFICEYPLDLDNIYSNLGEYYYHKMNIVNNLTIEKRFDRFSELLHEEKDCYYIFQILNTKLQTLDEITYGNITYYNEKIFKSNGFRNHTAEGKDSFRNKNETKAIIPFKTKRYFSNISSLKVKRIIENNLVFFKLFNYPSKEKEKYFQPSPSKIFVSYSHFVLDENFYTLNTSSTIYDGDFTLQKNELLSNDENKEFQQKLNSYLNYLNARQIKNELSDNDYFILRLLEKYKLAIESVSYSDILIHTWNGLEFLTKPFSHSNQIQTIQDLLELIYSLIYTNEHHRWDMTKKDTHLLIKNRAEHLVVYAYTYRNKLTHYHLEEDCLMISVTKGLNIMFREFLIAIVDKVLSSPDINIVNIISQLNNDLNKRINQK